jgi:hypothetical protein
MDANGVYANLYYTGIARGLSSKLKATFWAKGLLKLIITQKWSLWQYPCNVSVSCTADKCAPSAIAPATDEYPYHPTSGQ